MQHWSAQRAREPEHARGAVDPVGLPDQPPLNPTVREPTPGSGGVDEPRSQSLAPSSPPAHAVDSAAQMGRKRGGRGRTG